MGIENYVALGTLSKWFYSDLTTIAESELFVEPDTLVGTWNKAAYVGWSKGRGLDFYGIKKVLRQRV